MTRFMRMAFVSVVVLAVGLASCSNDSSSSTNSTASTSNPSNSSTSELSTSTASSTSTSTSTSTPIADTTTTVDQVARTKEAVVAAAVQSRQDYLYALVNYDAPDALTVLGRSTASESPSWALSTSNLDQLRQNGWRARLDPSIPSVTTVEGDVELLDGPPATRAEVTVCTVDSPVLYEPGAAPDGSDTIVNDQVISRRNRLTLVMENGAWKLYEGTVLGSWDGPGCEPA